MHIETFEIAHRFRGPPRSGNGGYTCGRIAKHLVGPVTARLHAPPPLNAELRLETLDARAQLFHDTTLIGEAQCAALNLELPPAPSFADADQAARSFIGFKTHGFPGCFVCGPERVGTDGLRIFPGSLDNGAALAAPWTHRGSWNRNSCGQPCIAPEHSRCFHCQRVWASSSLNWLSPLSGPFRSASLAWSSAGR